MRKCFVMRLLVCPMLCLLWADLTTSVARAEPLSITTLPQVAGKTLRIEVTTGDQWLHVTKALFFNITAPPQVAIWIEDQEGRFIDTLFITGKMGRQFWGKQPNQDPDKVLYKEALPYWMYKRFKRGLPFPTKNSPLPDTITAASPKEDFVIQTKIHLDVDQLAVLLEANISFDYNDTYYINAPQGTTVYNKNSGQPAVVYKANIDLRKPGKYEMQLIGHASPSGEDGNLYPDVDGLTTVLHLIKKAVVIIE